MSTEFDPQNVSTWSKALWDNHLNPSVCDRIQITHSIARQTVPEDGFPEADWKTLVGGGLLETLLRIMRDQHLCGFTLSELQSGDYDTDEAGYPYIIDIFSIFNDAINYLANDDDLEARGQSSSRRRGRSAKHRRSTTVPKPIQMLAEDYPGILEALWAVAQSFLTVAIDIPSPLPFPRIVHECVSDDCCEDFDYTLADLLLRCYMGLDGIACAFAADPTVAPGLNRAIYLSARLMLAIWIHTCDPDTKEWGLTTMHRALEQSAQLFPNDDLDEFWARFVRDTTGEDSPWTLNDVYFAIIDWLYLEAHDPSVIIFMLLLKCILHYRLDIRISIRDSTSRELLWYTMAAFRAKMCSIGIEAAHIKTRDEEEISPLTGMGVYLCRIFGAYELDLEYGTRPPVPELWVHAVLSILGIVTVHMIENHAVTNTLIMTIRNVGHMLCHFQTHPSKKDARIWTSRFPPSPSVRKHSLTVWQRTQGHIRTLRTSLNPKSRAIYEAWQALRTTLESEIPLDDQGNPSNTRDFGPLERCAYRECECGVYRAIHHMKICKGCFAAAYCKDWCQVSDWEEHRKVCRKR